MEQSEFEVRQATASDVDAAYDLIAQLGYPGLSRNDFQLVFQSVISHTEMLVLLAVTSSGAAIGLESISFRPQLRLAAILVTIDELVVAEAARGIGVGKALLEEAKKLACCIAKRNGLSVRLQLETNRSRESYQRNFYLKNGFEEANSAIMRYRAD